MTQACPLLFRQIDATVVRIGSFFVLLTMILYLMTSHVELLYLLSIDFLVRIYGERRFSVITQLSVMTRRLIGIESIMTDAGAKRLAAQFGLLFLLALILTFHLDLAIATYMIALFFMVCVSMELFAGYCVGCKVYFILKRLFPEYQ